MPNQRIAITLSLILPGAGQFYQGRIKAGWIIGIIGLIIFFYTLTYRMVESYVWILLCIGVNIITRTIAVLDILRRKQIKQPLAGSLKKKIISMIILVGLIPVYFSTLWPFINVKMGIYKVPSTGNEPTIFSTDMIWVDYNYYKNHDLEYGHITVFENKKQHWFYRVVGKPGDMVEIRNNHLFINGDSCSLTYIKDTVYSETYTIPAFQFRKAQTETYTFNYEQYLEVLPNGHTHFIYLSKNDSLMDKETVTYKVPEKQYFLMGDNRNGSMDSRYLGTINISRIQGRVVRMLLSEKRGIFWEDLKDK